MPIISQRGIDMPASPIRKLAPFAVAAKQKGIKVYHLNIGQPDIATPQEGLDALKNIDRKVLEYSPSQGYQSYLDKLVGYYGRYDIKLDSLSQGCHCASRDHGCADHAAEQCG